MSKLQFSENAIRILQDKYLIKDEKNQVMEKPEEMFARIANTLGLVESKYKKSVGEVARFIERFREVLENKEFILGGRSLANIGNPHKNFVISNCVVLHIKDDLKNIFTVLRDAAILQQAGCGIGFPFSDLREAGRETKRTGGKSSGPVSFMNIYNTAFGVIKNSGRHGANMAVLSVDHPDILEFIHCKDVEGALCNFNISVSVTDEFMQRVVSKSTQPWLCSFGEQKDIKPRIITRDKNFEMLKIEPVDRTALEIWNEIVHQAWKNGEPGLIFSDTVNRDNPLPGLGRIKACNPCAEQHLHDGDACNLGSINVASFVKVVDGGKTFDTERLIAVLDPAIRMLDNVIDLLRFPVEKVQLQVHKNRRMGLGIMGLADLFYELGIEYGSDESIALAGKIMRTIQTNGRWVSLSLSEEKGCFPNIGKSVWHKKMAQRNCAITNVAPTGTTSLVFDVSSGIEPYWSLAFKRSKDLVFFNQTLKRTLIEHGLYTDELVKKIIANKGSVQGLGEIPEKIRRVFVTAKDISCASHIRIQAECQKYCDNAISKTVNLPETATEADVCNAYLLMYKLGCKGGTVYRDNSRAIQVLNPMTESDLKPSTESFNESTIKDNCKGGKCGL